MAATPTLPTPIEICLEELDDMSSATPYVRCVAIAGGQPGLCFSAEGELWWRLNDNATAELWVSRDGQLIFYRSQTKRGVSLTRVERHLELPLGKPVVVLDGDEIRVGSRHYRIHVHGATHNVTAPERLVLARVRQLAVGAVIAAGTLTASCRSSDSTGTDARTSTATAATTASVPVGARTNAGEPPPSITDAGSIETTQAGSLASTPPDAEIPSAAPPNTVKSRTPPITVRPHPPRPAPQPRKPVPLPSDDPLSQ